MEVWIVYVGNNEAQSDAVIETNLHIIIAVAFSSICRLCMLDIHLLDLIICVRVYKSRSVA